MYFIYIHSLFICYFNIIINSLGWSLIFHLFVWRFHCVLSHLFVHYCLVLSLFNLSFVHYFFYLSNDSFIQVSYIYSTHTHKKKITFTNVPSIYLLIIYLDRNVHIPTYNKLRNMSTNWQRCQLIYKKKRYFINLTTILYIFLLFCQQVDGIIHFS